MLRDNHPPAEGMLGIPVFGRLRTAFHGPGRYSLSVSPDDVKERFARTDFILDMYESGVYNREEAGEKLFDHLFGKGRAVMDSEG